MTSSRFSDVRSGSIVSAYDASVAQREAPTAEALSRWENEGGAPDRQGEFDNHTAQHASPLFPVQRSALNAVEQHQTGSRLNSER